jgi:hypothetical protein
MPHNIELSCAAASAQRKRTIRTQLDQVRIGPRRQLQRFVIHTILLQHVDMVFICLQYPNLGYFQIDTILFSSNIMERNHVKSIHSTQYSRLLKLLVSERRRVGMTQVQLAIALNKPQSFISKLEKGERRIDLIEFLSITTELGIDPCTIIRHLEEGIADRSGR